MRKRTKILTVMGLGCSVLAGMLSGGTALAANTTNPTVTLTIGGPNGGAVGSTSSAQQLRPVSTAGTSNSHYYVPVTIKTTTADKYTVNVKASTNGLKSENNDTIANVSGSKTLDQLSNEWGYRYKTNASSTSDGFSDSDTTAFTALTTTGTNIIDNQTAPTSNKYIILDFGAGVTSTTKAGSYTTKVTVSAVATPKYLMNVIYNTNGGTGGPGTVEFDAGTSSTPQITIPTTLPTREYYGFLGWTTEQISTPVASANAVTTVNNLKSQGKFYAPSTSASGASNKINVYELKDITLYALWEDTGYAANVATLPTTMQSFGTTHCSKLGTTLTPSTYNMQQSGTIKVTEVELEDTRDTKKYKVAKLADNNCWMVQNLALGEAGKTIAINSENSDVASDSTYALPTTSTTNFSDTKTSGTYLNNQVHFGSHIGKGSTQPQYDNKDNNTGNYYSWFAATAGTGNASQTTGGQEAPYSICPKGWKLPTGGSSGQFKALYSNSSYNDYTKFNNAWHGALVGYYYTSGLGGSGSYGGWWSRTAYDAAGAYSMVVNTSGFGPTNYDSRYLGFSVRCVLGS